MATGEGLHKHAFWLYGVIIGLAIKEALAAVIPHVFNPPPNEVGAITLEAARLFVFLVVTIRFFLGSVFYFDCAHTGPGCDDTYPNKDYYVDFLFGLVHFIFFFAWALSIDAFKTHIKLFPGLLTLILLYDWLWYLVSRRYDTQHVIKLWTWINTGTVTVAGGVYLAFRAMQFGPALSQAVAFVPVVIFSLIDIGDIMRERDTIGDWLRGLSNRRANRPGATG
ncbi:MAG TPA: hypothetical protein VIP46_15215 [Pyrinomonadaceae bacterium]